MPKTVVHVSLGLIEQTSQQIGVEYEHMVARIHCRLEHKGDIFQGTVAVKQVTGSGFHESDNIEVMPAEGYGKRPMDWNKFARMCAVHYKKGLSGAIAIGPSAQVTMTNNSIHIETTFDMKCETGAAGGW
jgi:hypothetical protein